MSDPSRCVRCGDTHDMTLQAIALHCLAVRSITYYAGGTIKRVNYFDRLTTAPSRTASRDTQTTPVVKRPDTRPVPTMPDSLAHFTGPDVSAVTTLVSDSTDGGDHATHD